MEEEKSVGASSTESVQPSATKPASVSAKKDPTSMVAMVLAILSLVLFWMPYVGVILGALGIIYGYRGTKTDNKKLGQIALGLSILGLIASVLLYLSVLPWSYSTESFEVNTAE